MRKLTKILAIASILAAGLAVAPTLYAEDAQGPSGSTTEHGMMGDHNMMGQGDMMGMMKMMKMMKQMSRMMDRCSNMMSDGRPNDQWRKNTPSEPEKKG